VQDGVIHSVKLLIRTGGVGGLAGGTSFAAQSSKQVTELINIQKKIDSITSAFYEYKKKDCFLLKVIE